MQLEPGEQIDRYRIVARLGAGGMGEVYSAFDTLLQRHVALKLLLPEAETPGSTGARGSSGSARILREARAAAALEHPNVVHVYDVGELREPPERRGVAYLAMEMIQGKPLRAYVSEATPMSDRLRWLRDIALALGAAHERGLVHRDVKPENVMIRNDGVVKVLDFGIAKRNVGVVDWAQSTEAHVLSSLSKADGVAIGTPYYMAPEQMRGEAIDGRADQFSWGVVAFELLVGRGPWKIEGADALSLVAQVLSKRAEIPRALNAEIPEPVSLAITRALAKERDDRFPTMSDLIATLDLGPGVGSRRSLPGSGSGSQGLGVDAAAKTMAAPEVAQLVSESQSDASKAAAAAKLAAMSQVTRTQPFEAQASARRPTRNVATWLGVAVAIGIAVAVGAFARRTGTNADAVTTPAATARATACTTNADCVRAHGGEPYLCHKDEGSCVALAADGCVVHAEPADLENDRTIWLGVRMHHEYIGDPNAIELARRDFAELPPSLPGVSGVQVRRPIAVVECDEPADPIALTRHLVEEARVPAIIGFRSSQEAIDMLASEVIPHGTMTIIPLSTSARVMAIPMREDRPRLVWRTTDNVTQLGKALSALAEEFVEPRLHREGRRTIDVALVRAANAAGVGLSDAVVTTLRLNGGTIAENQTHFAEYVVDGAASPEQFAQVTRALAQQRPSIVIFHGWEYVAGLFAPLERALPPGAPRPTYLSAGPFGSFDGLESDVAMQKRFLGLTTPSNTSVNVKFTLHYNATFPVHVTLGLSPNTTYDAFYVLAYAAYALGDEPVTGEALAANVKRLVGPGKTIEVGPARILDGLRELGAGRAIDLQGAGSDLDFDLATGEDPTNHVVLCVGRGSNGEPIGVESGLVYAARAGSIQGALRCP